MEILKKWEFLAYIFLKVSGMEPLQIFLKTPSITDTSFVQTPPTPSYSYVIVTSHNWTPFKKTLFLVLKVSTQGQYGSDSMAFRACFLNG